MSCSAVLSCNVLLKRLWMLVIICDKSYTWYLFLDRLQYFKFSYQAIFCLLEWKDLHMILILKVDDGSLLQAAGLVWVYWWGEILVCSGFLFLSMSNFRHFIAHFILTSKLKSWVFLFKWVFFNCYSQLCFTSSIYCVQCILQKYSCSSPSGSVHGVDVTLTRICNCLLSKF